MDIQADRQTTDSLIPIFLHSGKLKNAVPFDIKRAGNGIFKPSILFFTGLILKAAFFQFYVFKALGFFLNVQWFLFSYARIMYVDSNIHGSDLHPLLLCFKNRHKNKYSI